MYSDRKGSGTLMTGIILAEKKIGYKVRERITLKFTKLEPFRFPCVSLILLLTIAYGIALPCINPLKKNALFK